MIQCKSNEFSQGNELDAAHCNRCLMCFLSYFGVPLFVASEYDLEMDLLRTALYVVNSAVSGL